MKGEMLVGVLRLTWQRRRADSPERRVFADEGRSDDNFSESWKVL